LSEEVVESLVVLSSSNEAGVFRVEVVHQNSVLCVVTHGSCAVVVGLEVHACLSGEAVIRPIERSVEGAGVRNRNTIGQNAVIVNQRQAL